MSLLTSYLRFSISILETLKYEWQCIQHLELNLTFVKVSVQTGRISDHFLSAQRGVCPGDVCLGGCLPGVSPWGVSAQGVSFRGCLPGGGSVCLGGVYTEGCLPDIPVYRMTERQVYKHYLAATSLRTVKMT